MDTSILVHRGSCGTYKSSQHDLLRINLQHIDHLHPYLQDNDLFHRINYEEEYIYPTSQHRISKMRKINILNFQKFLEPKVSIDINQVYKKSFFLFSGKIIATEIRSLCSKGSLTSAASPHGEKEEGVEWLNGLLVNSGTLILFPRINLSKNLVCQRFICTSIVKGFYGIFI